MCLESTLKNTFGFCLLEADKGHRSLILYPDVATAKFIRDFPSSRICSPPAYLTNSSVPLSWARAAPDCPKTSAQTSSHHSRSFTSSAGLLVCIPAQSGVTAPRVSCLTWTFPVAPRTHCQRGCGGAALEVRLSTPICEFIYLIIFFSLCKKGLWSLKLLQQQLEENRTSTALLFLSTSLLLVIGL